MQRDRDGDTEEEGDDAQHVDERGHADTTSSSARERAQASAAKSPSRVRSVAAASGRCSSTTVLTVSRMPRKGKCPCRNASTQISFAALKTAGAVRPYFPARRASETAGNAWSSRGANSHAVAPVQSHGTAA